jgi:hypothetical protein
VRLIRLPIALLLTLSACGGATAAVDANHDGGGGGSNDASTGHDSGGGGGTTCGAAGSASACKVVAVGKVVTSAGLTSIVDDETNVYVADEGGQIQAISEADGTATLLGNIGAVNADLALAVGPTDIYFASQESVGSVPKAGGSLKTLVADTSADGLAAAGTTLFWGDIYTPGVTGGPSGKIYSLPFGGGTPTAIATKIQIDFPPITDGINVYWIGDDGDLDAVPVGGGAVNVLASKQSGAESLAADGVNLYWSVSKAQMGECGICPPPPAPTATDSAIYKVPINGGTPNLLATGYVIQNFAIDGQAAYWFDSNQDTLSVVSLTGGEKPRVLAEGVNSGDGLLADTPALYWISTDGTLMKLVKRAEQP